MFLLLISVILAGRVFSQGTVVDEYFESAAMGGTAAVDVYLPEGYDPEDTETRYPVIYFLHGGGSSQNGYPEIITAMNNAVGTSILPAIMVKPNGGPMNWWTDSENSGMYATFVVEDVITYIDQNYNTIATPEKRAIMGHSLGGYGTMAITLRHPELFCAAASHGGALHMPTNFIGSFSEAVAENGGSGPYDPNAGWWTGYLYDCSAVFSPNMDNPPHNVDLPIDNNGDLIPEVWARWMDDDPGYLASLIEPQQVPPLYLDAGTSDFSYFCANEFTAILDTLGVGYQYFPYPGGHMNQLPARYPISLAFLDSVLHKEVPRAFNSKALPRYIEPGLDSTTISTYVPNMLDHEINITASVRRRSQSAVEVITLFDDGLHNDGEAGDQVWANTYGPGDGEDYYTADILVEDITEGSEVWSWDAAYFSTVGPVTFYELRDTTGVAVPGERYVMKIVLLNQSETDTITGVKANLIIDESLATVAAVPRPNYGEMLPGFPDEHTGLVRLDINENVILGSEINVQMLIESDGIILWEDSFSIPVATSAVGETSEQLPQKFSLDRLYPNPFNPTLNADISLPISSQLRVNVYNLMGQHVETLANDYFSAGRHTLLLNGDNLASGVYFVEAFVPEKLHQMQKVVLLK